MISAAVNTCEKGMVTDILMRVDADEFQAFVDRWGITPENEHTFSAEQRRQIERDNPLGFRFRANLTINGKTMRSKQGCSTVYEPSR